ncbi:hypothetical protein SRB5_03700 [Streptomyces sp. RB5]|uniref:Uncharacterized protein n=1 Tax=Streptomyces smaragdinus TaxID=2585196 RepID=A0A7K0CA45_9ACTN|nr:hypothetical protein [Streptomyces smaragdinus]MQY10263.1 hypothetical protein [Streptomyces smaragdinus]
MSSNQPQPTADSSESDPPPAASPDVSGPLWPFDGYPPATRSGNALLGFGVGVLAAFVAAFAYGYIIKVTEHEVPYVAFAIALLVGSAVGRLGNDNPALPFLSALLTLASAVSGQFFGEALIGADVLKVPVLDMYGHHFGLVSESWQADIGGMSYFFLVNSAIVAYLVAKKAGDSH